MLATFAAAALICAASGLVGEAVARLLGLEQRRGWSPAVGLATILVVALAAVKLPGHGTTGAIALGLLVAASAVTVLRTGGISTPTPQRVALTALVTAGACIPYLSNGRFGLLAHAYNNDLSAHIPWASWLSDPGIAGGYGPTSGYPIGPHSLVAALTNGTGIEIEWCFMGLLLALPALTAWATLPLLDGLGRTRQALGALLVAGTYTMAAFYAQAGFKELALTLFLLAMVGVARAQTRPVPARLGVQLGLLGAGIVFTFSYGGLAWPILTAVVWAALAIGSAVVGPGPGPAAQRLRTAIGGLRAALPAVIAATVTGVALLALDAGRLIDSLTIFGSSPSGTGALTAANIGHLAGPVSKRQLFGFWPREDFRFGIEQTAANEVLSLLAIAVVVCGGLWWLWRRDMVVPAAGIAAVALLVYLGRVESPYTASKALAPAGALAMLIAIRPLLTTGRLPSRLPRLAVRLAQAAIAALFVGASLWSSYLVLRGAQVGPRPHPEELAELQPEVEGRETLFLGDDDFLRAELPGVLTHRVAYPRAEKSHSYGEPLDFDSVPAGGLVGIEYVIAPRTKFSSELPASFRIVRSTGSFDLWRRNGPLADRRTLAEDFEPGAVLDCDTRAGRDLAGKAGRARIWTVPPVVAEIPQPPIAYLPGDVRTGRIALPPGRWELSAQYTSPQDVAVEVDGRPLATLPAARDRPGPYWRIGELDQPRRETRRLRFAIDADPLDSQTHVASLTRVAAVRVDAPKRTVPLREACGRYVDWYVLNAAPSGAG